MHELATLLGQGMSRIVAETRRIIGAATRQCMFYPHVAHQRCRGASAAARRCLLSPPRTTTERLRRWEEVGCFSFGSAASSTRRNAAAVQNQLKMTTSYSRASDAAKLKLITIRGASVM